MMKTKRQIDVENKALRARLGALAGETRKSLNARVKAAEEENKRLKALLAQRGGGESPPPSVAGVEASK